MSVLERFRNRKNRAMVFTVQYPEAAAANPEKNTPEVKPEIELSIRRIPQTLINNAIIKASGTLSAMNIDESSENYRVVSYMWFCYHLVEYFKGHIASWKALDEGEKLPAFSPMEFEEWLADLSIPERQLLGMAYMNAQDADQKKITSEPSSETAS